jgi:large subunit ribosomal protein L16
MQLMPKRVKHRKSHRGRIWGDANRGNTVEYGDFGLMALEWAWISARQLEAARMAAAHALGTSGRLYMRVFPHKPISAHPAETRMGKGKGEPEYYAATVRKGTILLELAGVPEEIARQILNLVAHKMPIRVRMVARRAAL